MKAINQQRGNTMFSMTDGVLDMISGKPRPICSIARDIKADWRNVNYAAKPYLDAMMEMDSTGWNYYQDSGKAIVGYFLANAGTWRGPIAQAIKAELRGMI